MLSFLDKTLVIFDLEVTDVEDAKVANTSPEVIELGAVRISSSLEILDTFSTLVRPQNRHWVTDFTTQLTGITPEMLDDAPQWATVYPGFLAFCGGNHTKLGGWHVRNDANWLQAQYWAYKFGFPHPHQFIDVFSIVYFFCSWYGIKPAGWSLTDCCKRFDVTPPSHRALSDALSTVQLLQAIQRIENAHQVSGPVV